MKPNFMLVVLALSTLSLPLSGQEKPNISGVWKLDPTLGKETMKIEHKEPTIHIIQDVDDQNGKRTLDMAVKMDGKEHKQEVQGLPAVLVAKWQKDELMLETKRQRTFGAVHIRRLIRLSRDGKTLTHQRTNYNPDGTVQFTRTEIWQKQD